MAGAPGGAQTPAAGSPGQSPGIPPNPYQVLQQQVKPQLQQLQQNFNPSGMDTPAVMPPGWNSPQVMPPQQNQPQNPPQNFNPSSMDFSQVMPPGWNSPQVMPPQQNGNPMPGPLPSGGWMAPMLDQVGLQQQQMNNPAVMPPQQNQQPAVAYQQPAVAGDMDRQDWTRNMPPGPQWPGMGGHSPQHAQDIVQRWQQMIQGLQANPRFQPEQQMMQRLQANPRSRYQPEQRGANAQGDRNPWSRLGANIPRGGNT